MVTGKRLAIIAIILFTLGTVYTRVNSSTNHDPHVVRTQEQTETKTAHSLADAVEYSIRNDRAPSSQKIPATIDELEKKYSTKFGIDQDPDGVIFRLSGIIQPRYLAGSPSEPQTLLEFLESASQVMNIDPSQLHHESDQKIPLGKVTNFSQEFEGIPVDGGLIRVFQYTDKDGNPGAIYQVNNSTIPNIEGININPSVPAEDAIQVARTHALSLDPSRRPLEVKAPQKIIHQFTEPPHRGKIDLCWKILVIQSALVGHEVGEYFINAHDKSVFERRETAVH